jgi:uncharacterized membrane protein YqjE
VFRRNGQVEEKSLREVVYEIKDELRDFAVTRLEMFKTELREKFARVKTAIPLMIGGAVFAIGAFFALTFGLIAAIAGAMPENQWRWAIGAGAIFLLYAIVGGILGWMGYREVTTEGLAPQRTLRVLKQDQIWIQNEARSA